MNILPKKRWHVRTKENIARVKADEAKFSDETLQKEFRANLAEQESRTDILRKRNAFNQADSVSSYTSELSLLSQSDFCLIRGNKEHEEEIRSEKEKEEKSIGLLTYLGQSVLDAGGQKPWYEIHPKKRHEQECQRADAKVREEWEAKKKAKADPLTVMNRVSCWFDRKRERKVEEEALRMRQANACISAMPSLFPDDISVPKFTATQKLIEKAAIRVETETKNKDTTKERKRKQDGDEYASKRSGSMGNSDTAAGYSRSTPTTDLNLSPLKLPDNAYIGSDCSTSAAINLIKKSNIDTLRAERLQRERRERERAAILIAKAAGLPQSLPIEDKLPDERNLPFNSAFNPELSSALAERRQKYKQSRRF